MVGALPEHERLEDSFAVTTLLLTHPASYGHDMGPSHPERPDRIRAIEQALEAESFSLLARAEAPRVAARRVAARASRGLYRGDRERLRRKKALSGSTPTP